MAASVTSVTLLGVEPAQRLREIGCQFALDDFGTGFSSLAYLKALPVTMLKIDGSFVRDVIVDPRSQSMVRAIAQLAKTMNMETVAEYVETDEIRRRVASLGVDYGQGFCLGKPQPLTQMLKELPLFEAFDQPDTLTSCPVRAVSTFAPQALILLNGPFMQAQCRTFAARLLREAGPDNTARVERAYLLALARRPSYFWLHLGMVSACRHKGDLADGLAHARAALALRPDSIAAREELAQMLVLSDRHAEAVGHLRSLVAHTPTLLRYQGYRVVEVPVNHRPRKAGQSKYGIRNRLVRGIVDCFAMLWWRRRAVRATRVLPESEAAS